MKKAINKPVFIVSMTIILILASLSANKSLFPSSSKVSQETKMICIQFQNLRGSSRISEFKKIVAEVFSSNQSSLDITLSDIEKLLGKPDNILENGTWEYYLDYNQEGSKVIIIQNTKDDGVTYKFSL